MAGNVLITGASGLLGRELTGEFLRRGFTVTAQFYSTRPESLPGTWIGGDLSTPRGVRHFLRRHRRVLSRCTHFVHAYGPITPKSLAELQPADFLANFHGNVTTFHAISMALMQRARLESAVAIGFDDVGEVRPYRRILTHACAKSALLLLVVSLAREYPETRFNMVSPSTLAGARVPAPKDRPLKVSVVAEVVADTLAAARSGIHLRLTPEHPLGEVVYAI